MTINFLGYTPLIKSVVISTGKDINLGQLFLEPKSNALNEVKVIVEKEFLETRIDRKVYNVDKLILNPGESVLNVLKNIPSIDVNMNGIISIRNNSQIQILIDGKPSALSGSALLEQIPANTIAKIEIINNPGARFDAEGTGGIINIILKKERQAGYNCSISGGVGERKKYNTGIILNYNTSKFNISTDYSYRYWELTNDMGFFNTNLQPDTIFYFDLKTRWMSLKHTHRFNTGIDYEIDKKNSLNISGTFNFMKQFSPEDLENVFIDENQIASKLYQRKIVRLSHLRDGTEG